MNSTFRAALLHMAFMALSCVMFAIAVYPFRHPFFRQVGFNVVSVSVLSGLMLARELGTSRKSNMILGAIVFAIYGQLAGIAGYFYEWLVIDPLGMEGLRKTFSYGAYEFVWTCLILFPAASFCFLQGFVGYLAVSLLFLRKRST